MKAIAETKLVAGQRREYFFDFINLAKRIKAENPDSKLTDLEFSKMNDIVLRELLEDESNGIISKLH